VQSTVLRLYVVCLFVCLLVTLVGCDHIGWTSWKLIARTSGPTYLRSSEPKSHPPVHLHPGKYGEILGKLQVGWGKSGVMGHKSGNISETRKYTPCLKKLCKLNFCQNFVKFRPIVKIFGTKIAKRTRFSAVYSFSTSPNLCQRTTVLNADVPNCYIK